MFECRLHSRCLEKRRKEKVKREERKERKNNKQMISYLLCILVPLPQSLLDISCLFFFPSLPHPPSHSQAFTSPLSYVLARPRQQKGTGHSFPSLSHPSSPLSSFLSSSSLLPLFSLSSSSLLPLFFLSLSLFYLFVSHP